MGDDLFYRVSVDAGGVTTDISRDISSATVDQREDRPDQLTVELADTYKVLSHALQEGMDVEVELGTDEDHSIVFRGRIYRVAGIFPKDAVPTLRLQAYDGSMRMGLRKRNRTFTSMSLSDIVNSVASAHFDDVRVDVVGDPQFSRNGIRQNDETDLAFLRRLAEAYGCVAYVRAGDDGDTFNFIAQYNVMSADPEITLYYGRGDVPYRLLRFESSADVSGIELPRVLSGIDYDTGTPTSVSTADNLEVGDEGDPYFDENLTALRSADPVKAAQLELLVSAGPAVQLALRQELGRAVRRATPTFTTEAELATLAQNQFATSLRGMRATGGAVGVKELVARTSVGIADVGGRFSGSWYLSQVRHLLNREGFSTDFECRR